MRRIRLALLTSCLLPLLAQAASGGAWQATGTGPALENRGVAASSRPLEPPHAMSGSITTVYWRYELTSPAPADLQVRLCTSNRCVPIEGQNGATRGLTNVPAGETLRFIYQVKGQGRIWPTVRVRSNQVMVNYQR